MSDPVTQPEAGAEQAATPSAEAGLAAPPPPYATAPTDSTSIPALATERTPWGHVVVAAIALVGIVLNFVGGAGFPFNAPVEQAMNIGISIDLAAVILVCGIGITVALGRRPARAALVFPWIGLAFSFAVFVMWLLSSGGLWETLFLGGRGRYMLDTVAPFYAGIPWVLGAVFSTYGLRRGGERMHTVACIAGIVLWAIVLAGAIASALLYGMDLTD